MLLVIDVMVLGVALVLGSIRTEALSELLHLVLCSITTNELHCDGRSLAGRPGWAFLNPKNLPVSCKL